MTKKPAGKRTSRRNWLWGALGASAALGGGGLLYAKASSEPQVSEERRSLGLPGGARLRLAVLSDLHLCGAESRYTWLVPAVNESAADAVVIVGDTADHAGSLALMGFLGDLKARLGKYAVLGNWEYWAGVDVVELRRRYAALGVELLVNDVIALAGASLVGLDDWLEGKPDAGLVDRALALGPVIALSHCPVLFDELAARADGKAARRLLVLSGHTHGGQVAPFGIVLFTPRGSGRYVSGWYDAGGAGLYVTRGVGCSRVQLRLGSRPELLILDIE